MSINLLRVERPLLPMAGINTDGHLYVTNDFGTPSAFGGPTWTRTALGLSGTIYQAAEDPFSPLYQGTGNEANCFIATSTNLYKVTDLFGVSGGPTVTTLHTFAFTPTGFGRRVVDVSTAEPTVMVVTYYGSTAGHTGTWSMRSLDSGATWSAETQVTGHYVTDAQGLFPSLHLSSQTAGKAYTVAATATVASPAPFDGYVTSNYGAAWSALGNPDIQPGNGMGGDIHAPFHDNATERIVYHGHLRIGPFRFRLKRIEPDGTTITDISPADGTRSYGINRYRYGIDTARTSRRHVVLAGMGNDVDANTANNYHGVWVSTQYGNSWTNVVVPIAQNNRHPEGVKFAINSNSVFFAWGTQGYIAYSQNFGASIDDQRGNIAGMAGVGDFRGIVEGG